MVTQVLGSVYILAGVGLVFATFIAAAYWKLRVYEDPRIDVVTAMLPGANCGACGFPGCRNFAEQLVLGAVRPAGCNVINDAGAAEVAKYLGVEAGAANRKVARLLCAGGTDVAAQEADYRGLRTCAAAAAVAGGGKACAWGCLGYADCATACEFGAINMLPNGLPQVDVALCTACGDCVDACPKGLFTILPLDQKLLVQCRSLIEGDEVLEACRVACTTCGKCVVDAAPGLVSIASGVAVVDYAHNADADPSATRRCPTGAIVWIEGGGAQFVATPLQRRRDEALIGSVRQ
jgi:Na+-translocating ferredoxin:NAD+ oxidoreductase subunit B